MNLKNILNSIPSWLSNHMSSKEGDEITYPLPDREYFPRHRLQRKPLVRVTHVPWCMSGWLTRGGRENVPGIPGACVFRKRPIGTWFWRFIMQKERANNRTAVWMQKSIFHTEYIIHELKDWYIYTSCQRYGITTTKLHLHAFDRYLLFMVVCWIAEGNTADFFDPLCNQIKCPNTVSIVWVPLRLKRNEKSQLWGSHLKWSLPRHYHFDAIMQRGVSVKTIDISLNF